MKKLFLAISAMFLFFAVSVPVQGQWPEIDPGVKRKSPLVVDDGFGGSWLFYCSSSSNLISVGRSHSEDVRYSTLFGDPKVLYNEQLKFKERSLPVDAGLGVAFYGYLTALHKAGVNIEAILWVSMKTGEISDVRFRAALSGNEVMLSVPPRNFALYEDILKKTVKFEIPQGIVHSESMEEHNVKPESIYYQFDIKFPAPAEGEPDFLALPTAADK